MTKAQTITGGFIFLGIILLMFVSGWGWVLASAFPLENPIAQVLAWPVACSTRGCVTTHVWARQVAREKQFTQSVGQPAPTELQSFTTAVRRHLLEHASVVEPITAADARRYREEILHLKDEALLKESVGMTAAEYDQQIITPFLQQAALQQQRKAESISELYAGLSSERFVLVLPFHLRWDKDTASVVRRD